MNLILNILWNKRLKILFLLAIVITFTACKKQNEAEGSGIKYQVDDRILDFEKAFIASNFDLTNNGILYDHIEKGWQYSPIITKTDKYRGCQSIQFTLPPTTRFPDTTTDKSQYRFRSNTDTNVVRFGAIKYYGFAMKLDTSMPQVLGTAQFFQIWQGKPMSPPLEIRFKPGGSGNTFIFEMVIRNNTTSSNPSSVIRVCESSIQRGVWNKFILMAQLQNNAASTNGTLQLWVNNVQIANWNGRVGYTNPIEYGGIQNVPNANLDAYFGPYRARMMVPLKMYFDEVRYMNTLETANPDIGKIECK